MALPAASDAWLEQHYATPQTLVRISRRRRLNLLIAGEGGPTVILAPGMVATTLDWARVQPAVALRTRTVAFDKAGIGFSDPGPLPRTASAIVQDLRAALKAADLAPPYVLVGSSSGGLQMRLFAFRHPQEVAGMVMVDSASAYQYQRFAAALGEHEGALRLGLLRTYTRLIRLARAGALTPGTADYERAVGPPWPTLPPAVNAARAAQRTSAAYWRAVRAEAASTYAPDGGSPSSDELAAARRPLGDMPLIVLTAGRNSPQPRPGESAVGVVARRQLWLAMHDEIAALSTCGQRRTVEGAGHSIHLDRPEAVIAAIEEAVAAVRG